MFKWMFLVFIFAFQAQANSDCFNSLTPLGKAKLVRGHERVSSLEDIMLPKGRSRADINTFTVYIGSKGNKEIYVVDKQNENRLRHKTSRTKRPIDLKAEWNKFGRDKRKRLCSQSWIKFYKRGHERDGKIKPRGHERDGRIKERGHERDGEIIKQRGHERKGRRQ